MNKALKQHQERLRAQIAARDSAARVGCTPPADEVWLEYEKRKLANAAKRAAMVENGTLPRFIRYDADVDDDARRLFDEAWRTIRGEMDDLVPAGLPDFFREWEAEQEQDRIKRGENTFNHGYQQGAAVGFEAGFNAAVAALWAQLIAQRESERKKEKARPQRQRAVRETNAQRSAQTDRFAEEFQKFHGVHSKLSQKEAARLYLKGKAPEYAYSTAAFLRRVRRGRSK